MALTRRYVPSWPPGEAAWVGMDFSAILPPGVILTAAELDVWTNRNPADPSSDFFTQPVIVSGRQAWCRIAGGIAGTDYQLRFTATDSCAHIWNRTALMLCAESS